MSFCSEHSEEVEFDNVLGKLSTIVEALVGMVVANEANRIAARDSISPQAALDYVLDGDVGLAGARILGAVGATIDGLVLAADIASSGGDAADYTREYTALLGGIAGAAIFNSAAVTGLVGVATLSAPAVGMAIIGSIVGAAVAKTVHDAVQDAYCGFTQPPVSPLVLDLDGDGVELTSIDGATAYFDIDIDGFAESTGWVSADDGLLALDIDGDGKIDDGSELFGDQTGHAHGFLALAAHDDNSDDVIDATDAVFANLLVWQDLNADGVSQSDELQTLTEVGISSISVNATATNYQVAGNDILWEGNFTWSDGTTGIVADAFFEVHPIRTQVVLPDGFEYDEDVFDLPFLQGAGHLANSWYSLTTDVALRAQAVALVAQASSGNISGFRAAFEDFVMDWAGVGSVPTTGRGDYINGQHLAFLEIVFDQAFEQEGSANPAVNAAQELAPRVHQIIDAMAADFLSQVAVSDALLNSTDATQFEQILTANPFYGFTGDITQADDTINHITWQVEQGVLTISNAVATLNLWRSQNNLDSEQTSSMLESAWGTSSGSGIGFGQAFKNEVMTLASGDTIYIGGTSDDDVLTSTGLGATISGNGGDDVLFGAFGSDTYMYRDGDGSDLVVDQGWSSDPLDHDVFRFMDLEVEDMSFSHNSGGDLTITTSDGSVIVLTDHFSSTTYQIEYIDFGFLAFSDGSEPDTVSVSQDALNLQDIRDKSAADQVSSGFVRGTRNKDNYYHQSGDGTYTIYDEGYLSDSVHDDRLEFTNLAATDVVFSHTSGGDLTMTTSTGDVITVTDHFDNYSFEIETIAFSDTTLGLQGIRDKAVADQASTGFVLGSRNKENYLHQEGDGSYTISDFGYLTDSVHNDVLTFSNLIADEVQFVNNAGGDLVMTTLGGDVITVTDHFGNEDYDIETISFVDTTLGLQGIRDKTVADQVPTGFVRGTHFAENYFHAANDGSYTIYDFGYLSSSVYDDSLSFTDLNASDVQFSQNVGGDLVIISSAGDTITITDHFVNDNFDLETISFLDGTFDLQAIRNKSVADQASTGFVRATYEREYYFHAEGDGSYTIYDYGWSSNSGRTDIFTFSDLNSDEVAFEHNSNGDLVMKTIGGDVITITDHFVSNKFDMEQIAFADGVLLGLQGIRDKALLGSAMSDVMIGFSTNDLMTGGAGDDYIWSANGNDTVYGDAGNDTLFGGEGADEIFGGAGADYIDGENGDDNQYGGDGDDILAGNIGDDYFDGGAGTDTLKFTYTSSNVTYDLSAGTIVFASGFTEYMVGIENITAGSGSDTITGSADDNTLLGGAGNDSISGGSGDDIIDGQDGDDSQFGGNGDDVLVGNIGADYFDGGLGNDTLEFLYTADDVTIDLAAGAITFANGFVETMTSLENVVAGSGNNTITGTAGNNLLKGGDGDDVIDGGAGDDVIHGEVGNDAIQGGVGIDQFVFELGSGVDTIADFEDQVDVISFVGSGLTFGDLTLSGNGADALVDFGVSDQIILTGISAGQITSDDFIFV